MVKLKGVQFTRGNWNKYFTAQKKTTVRLRKRTPGYYDAVVDKVKAGVLLFEPEIGEKKVKELNENDARNEGFNYLYELLFELGRCYGQEITLDSTVFVQPTAVIEGKPLEATEKEVQVKVRGVIRCRICGECNDKDCTQIDDCCSKCAAIEERKAKEAVLEEEEANFNRDLTPPN